MSVVSTLSRKRSTTTAAAAPREVSEFDGFWLNAGVRQGTEEDSKFVRLPRGIAVSDLKHRKVYENMDPDFAAEVNLVNQIITLIQGKCAGLAEGESIPIRLEVVLYRRQEEAEVAADPVASTDLENALFG